MKRGKYEILKGGRNISRALDLTNKKKSKINGTHFMILNKRKLNKKKTKKKKNYVFAIICWLTLALIFFLFKCFVCIRISNII